MKKTLLSKKLGMFLLGSSFSLFMACGSKKDETVKATQETPKALTESKGELVSLSRNNHNLLEDIYKELLDKSTDLKALESEINAMQSTTYELNENYTDFNNKSETYYKAANAKLNSISDSVLKKSMLDLILKSSKTFEYKTSELKALIRQMSDYNVKIDDHYTVLQIVSTLALMEKFQNDQMPDKKEFKDQLKNQKMILWRTDSLTPKH